MTDRDPILDAVDLLAPAFEQAGLDELELEVGDRVLWGAAISSSIVGASLRAVMSGINRIVASTR